MNDKQLFVLIKSIVDPALVANGYIDVEVARTYQDVLEGADVGMAVYFHTINDNRYGFVQRKDADNAGDWIHTEAQQMETSFQVNARIFNPSLAADAVTANDLVNTVALIMQSDIALEALKAQNVGIYRITAVPQTYITDDSDRNERAPSFDFTLTHKRSIASTTPTISTFEADIYRV